MHIVATEGRARELATQRKSANTPVEEAIGDADPDPPSSRAREDRNIRNLYRQTVWQGAINAVITTFLPIFVVRVGASTFEVGLVTS